MSQGDLAALIPSHIRGIEAYIPSKPDAELSRMFACGPIDRLNNNENALGPSAAACRAIADFEAVKAAIYPSGDSYYLRCRLAEYFGLHEENFIVGNGANEVIAFVIHGFCAPGDNIVTADKTFAVYEWVAQFSGFEPRLIPLYDYGFDPEAMLAAADNKTKIFFICNPNNPTGTYWSESVLREFLRQVDGQAIVVLDEAYAEFVQTEDFPNGMELLQEYSNLVVFRTFSKMFALAGLRIGYLAGCREVVDIIRRTCIVYSVNTLAQTAALGSLEDAGEHIDATRTMIKAARSFMEKELDRLGLTYVSNEGNFMIIRLPCSDTLMYRLLMRRGMMVRTMTGFRFPNHIRITLGKMPVMQKFSNALEAVLNERRAKGGK